MNRTSLATHDQFSTAVNLEEFPIEIKLLNSEETSPSNEATIASAEKLSLRVNTSVVKLGQPTLIPPPKPFISHKPSQCFKLLQRFEGTIIEVSEDECRAHIRDTQDPDSIEEITFSLEEFFETDRKFAVKGAVFNWYIGYEDRSGQRYRASAIIFRRLPVWTKKDLEKAKQEAQLLFDKLGWEVNDTPGK